MKRSKQESIFIKRLRKLSNVSEVYAKAMWCNMSEGERATPAHSATRLANKINKKATSDKSTLTGDIYRIAIRDLPINWI